MIENPFSTGAPKGVYHLEVKLANLTQNDHAFLATIIAFFADPANDVLADRIRSGAFGLQYNPETGLPNVCDLNPDEGLPPSAMIEFFARFTKKEWKRLKPHRSALIRHFLISRKNAELYVRRVLGYGPKPVKIKIFTE